MVGVLVEGLAAAHAEGAVVGLVQEVGFLEDVELVLRAPLGQVGHAGVAQGLLGPAGDVRGRPGERGVRVGVGEAGLGEHGQGRPLAEGIDRRGGQVRHQDHVAVLDLEESVAGTVEADALACRSPR